MCLKLCDMQLSLRARWWSISTNSYRRSSRACLSPRINVLEARRLSTGPFLESALADFQEAGPEMPVKSKEFQEEHAK